MWMLSSLEEPRHKAMVPETQQARAASEYAGSGSTTGALPRSVPNGTGYWWNL